VFFQFKLGQTVEVLKSYVENEFGISMAGQVNIENSNFPEIFANSILFRNYILKIKSY